VPSLISSCTLAIWVKEYLKGYFGGRDEVWKLAEVDYKLSHPTKVVKVTLFKEKED
jgi:hypothetical protein